MRVQIGFAGGDPNLYGYVSADPVNLVDPSGLAAIPSCAANLLSQYFPRGLIEAAEIEIGIPWFVRGNPSGFTLGKIYIAEAAYNPNSIDGIALIGHELVHLRDQQSYMIVAGGLYHGYGLAYLAEYIRNRLDGLNDYDAYRSSRFEQHAFDMQRTIRKDLERSFPSGEVCPTDCDE